MGADEQPIDPEPQTVGMEPTQAIVRPAIQLWTRLTRLVHRPRGVSEPTPRPDLMIGRVSNRDAWGSQSHTGSIAAKHLPSMIRLWQPYIPQNWEMHGQHGQPYVGRGVRQRLETDKGVSRRTHAREEASYETILGCHRLAPAGAAHRLHRVPYGGSPGRG